MTRSFLLALALPLVACGAEQQGDGTTPPEADTLRDFRRGAGVEFASCGELLYPHDGGSECPREHAEVVGCLSQALAACTPAEVRVTRLAADGSSAADHYFVLPIAQGCEVVTFLEDSDRTDCRSLLERRCQGLAPLEGRCPALSPVGCGELVVHPSDDCGSD